MLRASIDLLGLYNYDNTVLNGLKLPTDEEGTELIDRSELIDNLLMETAELELVYGSAPFMKTAISAWSAKQVGIWHKLYNTMHFEYNPIWNKDGTIDEKITRNLAGTDNRTQDLTRTDNLSHSEDYTRTDNLAHTDDATTTTDVYGYNSSNAAPKTKVTVDNDTSDTGTQRNAGTSSNTGTVRNAGTDNRSTSDTGTIETSRTEQGNIGVTTTQEMIKQEREVVQFNVMDYIINDFKRRFCLMVY